MHKSKLKQISLAVCLAFMPIYGFAAGLGKLNVNSGLGEPLKAEIELLSLTPDELSTLFANVAPPEAYEVQGIPRLGIHNNIKVELAKGSDGSPILKLHSVQPVSEPYIDMLIQVDWASGRLLREYTILLDPPDYKQTANDATASGSAIINKPNAALSATDYTSQNQTAEEASSGKQQSETKSKKSKRQKTKAAEAATEAIDKAGDNAAQVTTQRGDSLLAIAKEVKLEGVSLDQMLVGLFEANKQAFVAGNMNRLKVGQILKVPTKETLTSIGSQQANKEVKLHSANWNAYRNSVAGNLSATDSAEQNQLKQSSSGKISSAKDLAAAEKAGPQDVVKLSAGGKQAAQDGKAGAGHDAKVLALQEEATAKEKALKEAQDRTSALEAQIADMQKLMALKNQAMANAQKSAELQSATATDEKSQLAKSPALKPSEVKPAASTDAVKQNNVPAEPVAVDKKTASSKPKKSAVPVAFNPEEESSFFEDILAGIDLIMLAAAGFVLLLAAGWAYLRNKRRRDLDSFERGILTSGGLSANTVFGNTTSNASTSDTSFLTDFAQSADGGMIDTNDVDPIAEAEVYMAYGRDAQAEEILKDAIVKEPKRYELHLKLLEMYAARKDISAFEAIAGELYTTLGSDNPTWAKVAELGVMVEPDNPLYDLSRLTTQPSAALPNGDTQGSYVANANKELDWEKELEPDHELEFSSNFSSVEEAAPSSDFATDAKADELKADVVTQFGNANVELEQDQSINSALSDEIVQFGGNQTTAQLSNLLAADAGSEPETAEKSQDNSLNFDFSELGNFSLDNTPTQSLDLNQSQADESIEFAPVLETPTAVADDVLSEISDGMQSVQDSNSALDFNFNVSDKVDTESSSSMSFEPVAFDLNDVDQPPESEQQNMLMPSLSGIDINFNDAQTLDAQQVEEINFDLPVVQDSIKIATVAAESASPTASNFDFSSINLDLSDAVSNTAALNSAEAINAGTLSMSQAAESDTVNAIASSDSAATEPANVDIKLDLVKVYIDMEDVEGARDLLNEVMKEGGPKQRQTAELLLANLV